LRGSQRAGCRGRLRRQRHCGAAEFDPTRSVRALSRRKAELELARPSRCVSDSMSSLRGAPSDPAPEARRLAFARAEVRAFRAGARLDHRQWLHLIGGVVEFAAAGAPAGALALVAVAGPLATLALLGLGWCSTSASAGARCRPRKRALEWATKAKKSRLSPRGFGLPRGAMSAPLSHFQLMPDTGDCGKPRLMPHSHRRPREMQKNGRIQNVR
jgi:hypothetical protein